MPNRAVRLAAVSVAALSVLLAGCGQQGPLRAALPQAVKTDMRARSAAADPAPFVEAAKKAIALMAKHQTYKNARLVSIQGIGLDHTGKLVPLLGASWIFKFWVAGQQGDYMVEVIHNVEGDVEVAETNEDRETERVRAIDPEQLIPPTQLVPMAIQLGLKVSRQAPHFNYYDITYNAGYADPSGNVNTDVADVVSYYRHDNVDGLRLPAAQGFVPGFNPAPIKGQAAKLSPADMRQAQAEHDERVRR